MELERGIGPGEWSPIRDGQSMSARVCCPACGWYSFLLRYYISDEGVVRPDFECQRGTCAFSAAVKLRGWESELRGRARGSGG